MHSPNDLNPDNEVRARQWRIAYQGPHGRMETTVEIGLVTHAEACEFIKKHYIVVRIIEIRPL